MYSGYEVPPYYDSMIAKLICTAATRDIAIKRMRRALGEFMIEGVSTTVPVGQALLADARFERGEYTTTFLENFVKEGFLISQ